MTKRGLDDTQPDIKSELRESMVFEMGFMVYGLYLRCFDGMGSRF